MDANSQSPENAVVTTAAPQLVVGTAGHIDHGKSRLVMALTGVDPDRLPEEKARGMTIDLGFAHAAIDGCNVWFVDVPGHERFIRNMVAGAAGVDIAMLVVAADDSVMPQTREHAELLRLLGVTRCIVVLTKMDLVDDDWAEAVEEEVGELLDKLRIEPLRFIRTSAESGRGIDEVRKTLAELARGGGAESSDENRWFRLPIDRAFNIAGRGTVVTGSLAHGAVRSDDELELWPGPRRIRVRDLQTHNVGTAAAAGRMRLALNLANVALDEVGRGCELATPGYLEATRRMDVWIESLRMPGKLRRKNLALRLHAATSEVLADLRLIDTPTDDPVTDQFGQLRIAEPIVATWGQRFILRDESGSRTLGGGRILRTVARPWSGKRPPHLDGLRILSTGTAKERLEEVIRANEWETCSDERLAARAGLPDTEHARTLCQQLGSQGRIQRLLIATQPIYLHRSHLDELAEGVVSRLESHLSDNPRLPGVARREWPGWMPRACPERIRPAVAQWLIDRSHVAVANDYVRPAGRASGVSEEDQTLLDALLAEFEKAAFQPPTPETLACVTPKNATRVKELIDLAAAQGQLVRIAPGLWLHGKRHEQMIRSVLEAIREKGGVTVAEIRTLLGSTRKYIVPIVEHLDATSITRRTGDLRVAGPKAPQ